MKEWANIYSVYSKNWHLFLIKTKEYRYYDQMHGCRFHTALTLFS